MPFSQLSRTSVNRALRRLSALLAAQSLRVDFALCHGRVFCVAYATIRELLDTSRFVVPADEAVATIARVATERGLPEDWIEKDLKFFLALGMARRQNPLADFEPRIGLLSVVPTHLLALKLQACQAAAIPGKADFDDVVFLIKRVRLRSAAEVELVYALYYFACRLDPPVHAMVARQAFGGASEGAA